MAVKLFVDACTEPMIRQSSKDTHGSQANLRSGRGREGAVKKRAHRKALLTKTVTKAQQERWAVHGGQEKREEVQGCAQGEVS